MSTEVEQAMNTLKKAFKADPDYAWGWHCNIAMACYDSMGDDIEYAELHNRSNEAAARFMKLCFDIDTAR